MSAILTNKIINKQEHKQIAENVTASFTAYIDDLADTEEPEITEEYSLDAPLEADEESEDDTSAEDYGVPEAFSLYGYCTGGK